MGHWLSSVTSQKACLVFSPQYGWIGRWIRPKKSTVGAMDLGGASTQITFETTGTIESPGNQVTLRLYGHQYKVYTHSFLCYGINEIYTRLTSKVLKVRPGQALPVGGCGTGTEAGGL